LPDTCADIESSRVWRFYRADERFFFGLAVRAAGFMRAILADDVGEGRSIQASV
jgi:hypothetical protein